MNLSLPAQSLQASFEKNLPDSVKYYLPAFENGRIVFKNGEYSRGMLNISTLDQSVRFIDKDGKEKALEDLASVDRINIEGFVFIRRMSEFVCISDCIGDVWFGVTKRLEFDDSKSGAYGRASQTTNIKQVGILEGMGGQTFDLNNLDFEIKSIAYLGKGFKIYPFDKKRLMKFFPDKKNEILKHTSDKKVNFRKFQDAYDIFQILKNQ